MHNKNQELEAYQFKINNLKNRLQYQEIEIEELTAKIKRINNSLIFKLGQTARKNSRSIIGWIKMPFALLKTIIKWMQSKKQNIVKSPKNNFPKPKNNMIILQANKLMQEGHIDQGIEFATKYAKGQHIDAIELLKANKNIENEKLWLLNINSYLKKFEIQPIELLLNADSRFHRIHAQCEYTITDGPLVTVIMPAYNAEAYIEHSVNSILNQTWKNIELIIIDDDSSDNTFSIMKDLSKNDKRIKIFHNSVNVGPYVSKNLALKYSNGMYITGHDADDWAHPQRIEKHVKYMLVNKNIKASTEAMIRMTKSGKIVNFAKISKFSPRDGALRIASISCMFQRKSLLDELGGWDCARFGADSELIERAEMLYGDKFVRLPYLTMICLDVETSLTNHLEHGISKLTGMSPIRKTYKDAWKKWHETLDIKQCYIPFPHTSRKFMIPDSMSVPTEDILILIDKMDEQSKSDSVQVY